MYRKHLSKISERNYGYSSSYGSKIQLRNLKPLGIAISTNDRLGINARNIGTLLITKNVYLVPFGQDNPKMKPNSLVAHMDRIPETILAACIGRQIQPVLLDYR